MQQQLLRNSQQHAQLIMPVPKGLADQGQFRGQNAIATQNDSKNSNESNNDMPQQQQQHNTYYQSSYIAHSSIQMVIKSFQHQLKVNSLTRYMPQFITLQLHKLNEQCVGYFYLQGESKTILKTKLNMTMEQMPKNIKKDKGISVGNWGHQLNIIKGNQCQQSVTLVNHSDRLNDNTETTSLVMINNNNLNYSNSVQRSSLVNPNHVKEIKSFTNTTDQNQLQNQSSLQLTPNTSTNIYSSTPREAIPLNLPSQKKYNIQPDYELQSQLEHMKKHLYQKRRYRKLGIEEERANMDLLNKRKSHMFFIKKDQHTYDYEGNVLAVKANKKTSNTKVDNNSDRKNSKTDGNNTNNISIGNMLQLTPKLTSPSQIDNNQQKRRTHKKKLSTDKASMSLLQLLDRNTKGESSSGNLSKRYMQMEGNNINSSNPQMMSQHRQELFNAEQKAKHTALFTNNNKRQVSHLPFISMRDNAKIVENNAKQLSGAVTERLLTKSKAMSMSSSMNGESENNTSRRFRSFSQIQLQKRLQKERLKMREEKVIDFVGNQSYNNSQVDILPPTLQKTQQRQQPKRQSRMMQKYLQKLTQQKTDIQKLINKDIGYQNRNLRQINFDNLSVPQKYPIQRYYGYDYDSERRRSINQHSISSKVSIISQSINVNKSGLNYEQHIKA